METITPTAEQAIADAVQRYRNWGRWGPDDRLGTVNFIDEAKRREAAALVRRGVSISLSQSFDTDGPQKGWRRRTNPVHTMTDTGTDAAAGKQGFPHGFGGADDVIAMPLQCSTQWDGLGHIFDHGMAWNGRPAGDVVTSDGDLVTGIEHLASPVCRARRPAGCRPGRRRTTANCPTDSPSPRNTCEATIAAQGADLAGRSRRHRPRAHRAAQPEPVATAGATTPAAPLPACPSRPRAGCTAPRSPRSPPTPGGSRCGPTSSPNAFQPLHQVAIPNMGLLIGEMWDLDALAEDCAGDGVYEFLLAAGPLTVTGAVGAPLNPLAVK